jgi:hypothetical protein
MIHSADDGYFDPTFYDPYQFSAIACGAKVNDTPVVFFPYLTNVPLGYLPIPFRDQKALQIYRDADGRYLTHGIVTIPDNGLSEDVWDQSVVVTLSENGDVLIDDKRLLQGGTAIELRDELEVMNEEDTRKALEELIGTAEGDLTLDSYEIENLKRVNQPLQITLHYRANNALTVTPEEIIFHTAGLLSPPSESHWKMDSTARQSPIVIYNDYKLQKDIKIVYPSTWRLATTLDAQQLSNRFGEVSTSYSNNQGELSGTLRTALHRARTSSEHVDELRQLISARSVASVPSLVFQK